MQIDKDDDRYEPTITRSTLPEQERKYFVEFPCYTSDTYYFDVNAYVDSIMKNVNEKIERRLAETGYIKVVRCKECKYYENGVCYPLNGIYDVVTDMDYCSRGERKEEVNETDRC